MELLDWLLPASLPMGSAIGAFIAAVFWFRSTQVEIPDAAAAPASGEGSVSAALARQGKWNGYAATAACVSAFCAAVVTLLKGLGIDVLF